MLLCSICVLAFVIEVNMRTLHSEQLSCKEKKLMLIIIPFEKWLFDMERKKD